MLAQKEVLMLDDKNLTFSFLEWSVPTPHCAGQTAVDEGPIKWENHFAFLNDEY